MAADVYGVLKQTELPLGWDYALTEDGRVFFVRLVFCSICIYLSNYQLQNTLNVGAFRVPLLRLP